MPQTRLGVPSVRFGLPQKVRLELPLGHCMTASLLILFPLRQTCQGQVKPSERSMYDILKRTTSRKVFGDDRSRMRKT